MISRERLVAVVDYDPETGLFTWKERPPHDFKTPQGYSVWRRKCTVGGEAGYSSGHGYLRITIDETQYYAHRLAWLYACGEWPPDGIDHINGNRSDNRLVNLRPADHTENHRNTRRFRSNTSGVMGVRLTKYSTWQARIHHKSKLVHLGTFPTMDEAVLARKAAEASLGYHENHGRSS